MLPIPGTSSIAHLEENLAAASIHLTSDEFRTLDAKYRSQPLQTAVIDDNEPIRQPLRHHELGQVLRVALHPWAAGQLAAALLSLWLAYETHGCNLELLS
jgi:hypothetical protein